MKIPLIYNVRSVMQRPVSTAFTALGHRAGGRGLHRHARAGERLPRRADPHGLEPERAACSGAAPTRSCRAASDRETRQHHLASSPHIATGGGRAADGEPRGRTSSSRCRGRATTRPRWRNVVVRGVSAAAWSVPHNVQIAEGQRPESGRAEICVGREAWWGGSTTPAIGETLRFAGRDWTVVCHFTAGGSAFESEIWGENEQFHAGLPGRGLPVGHVPAQGSGRVRGGQARARGRPARSPWTSHRESDFYTAAVAAPRPDPRRSWPS